MSDRSTLTRLVARICHFLPRPLPPDPLKLIGDATRDAPDRAFLVLGRLDDINAQLADTRFSSYASGLAGNVAGVCLILRKEVRQQAAIDSVSKKITEHANDHHSGQTSFP